LRRRAARLAVQIAAGFFVATAVPVIVLRWVPPLTSSIMLQREIGARVTGERGFVLRHHWVPLRQISPELAIAVVAAEDQKFPVHSGFDWGSIGDAISEGDARPRSASTLNQQVARTSSSGREEPGAQDGGLVHGAARGVLAQAPDPRCT
jgi:monofunctional biosynthetic peptidoglycan transglycosylase